MPGDLCKSVKKRLRELVYEAHEKALRQPLAGLSRECERWRRGEIDAIQLADFIREQEEPIHQIYRRFTWSRNSDLPMLVAGAIHDGLLDENALPAEVMESVGRWLRFIASS